MGQCVIGNASLNYRGWRHIAVHLPYLRGNEWARPSLSLDRYSCQERKPKM